MTWLENTSTEAKHAGGQFFLCFSMIPSKYPLFPEVMHIIYEGPIT